jgi:hypothetical protein
VLAAMVILGFRIWIDLGTSLEDAAVAAVGTFGLLNLILALVNLAKEKFGMALVGLFVSPVSLIGAVRLGRPHSAWAKVFYGDRKRARAQARFEQGQPRGLDRLRRRKREEPKPQSLAGSG